MFSEPHPKPLIFLHFLEVTYEWYELVYDWDLIVVIGVIIIIIFNAPKHVF